MPKTYRLPYTLRPPSDDPDEEDMWIAEVPSLPGCRAWAETPEEAVWILEDVAAKYIESSLEHGDPLAPELELAGEVVVTV
ncbi:MAG: type II toxin-antitoxin system HicB family antitoxin [Chloroflexi bacterium]|nr:type II toxin-antitoxin system HicB family antitoxin [Chloroflexota bacterium]